MSAENACELLYSPAVSPSVWAATQVMCPAVHADVFFLSAAAKLGATVVTYPLLLVKARLQSAGKHTSSDRKYTGTVDAIERIYKTEGDACRLASLDLAWCFCRRGGMMSGRRGRRRPPRWSARSMAAHFCAYVGLQYC